MTRRYVGTDLEYQTQVLMGITLTTPASITFQYKYGKFGQWNSVTPSAISTGIYKATVNPTMGGALFWMWKSTTPNITEEGMTYIQPSEFTNENLYTNYDYGFLRV